MITVTIRHAGGTKTVQFADAAAFVRGVEQRIGVPVTDGWTLQTTQELLNRIGRAYTAEGSDEAKRGVLDALTQRLVRSADAQGLDLEALRAAVAASFRADEPRAAHLGDVILDGVGVQGLESLPYESMAVDAARPERGTAADLRQPEQYLARTTILGLPRDTVIIASVGIGAVAVLGTLAWAFRPQA
jgi:hypothetical protein